VPEPRQPRRSGADRAIASVILLDGSPRLFRAVQAVWHDPFEPGEPALDDARGTASRSDESFRPQSVERLLRCSSADAEPVHDGAGGGYLVALGEFAGPDLLTEVGGDGFGCFTSFCHGSPPSVS
jgi:hypothetical protein